MALFEKGVSGNPAGKPKGLVLGRARALNALDQVVGRDENVALIEETLEKTLREKPMWFFVNIIMPLLPKETKGVVEAGDRVFEWRSLLSVCEEVVGGQTETKPLSGCGEGL